MRKGTLKKALALALTGVVLVGAFAGCGAKKDSGDKKETKKIVIGERIKERRIRIRN